jgi:NAD(P)-dependent dehydrogenase (short-subunit alcohol dehydrogenase family)
MASLFRRSAAFEPDKDIPDLSGKVILVTSGNNGLGKESILQLAKHNQAKIYMGARSQSKAESALSEINNAVPQSTADIVFLQMDLASFASIRKAVDTFLSENDRLDLLINNAGILGRPAGLTDDGYEMQFGTNHMGHALLTKLLLPILERTANEKTASEAERDVRIINLSSEGYKFSPAPGLLLSQNKTDLADISGIARYGQSKLANIYFTQGLASRHPSIKSVAVHPGTVSTGIFEGAKETYPLAAWLMQTAGKFFFMDVKAGAVNQLWAATAKSELVKSGKYYNPVGEEVKGSELVDNKEQAESLWEWTEKELAGHGF